MDAVETRAAIEIHALRNHGEAEKAQALADAARETADWQAKAHTNPDHAASIRAAGEREARGHEARAMRHTQRAETAEAGYLLHGKEERGDSEYSLKNRDLIGACAKHGLLCDQPKKPA